ncbi:hypothetical protein Tco_0408963 [Tanacetum coccineum]
MDSEKEAQKPGKRLKRVAGSYATQKSHKKPKVMKSAKDVTKEEAAEYEKEELRSSLKIISNDDSKVDYEPLSRKFPIVNWELLLLGRWTAIVNGTPMEINMLVEKKYPMIKKLLEKMLNLQLELEDESFIWAFELIKFIKSLLEERGLLGNSELSCVLFTIDGSELILLLKIEENRLSS